MKEILAANNEINQWINRLNDLYESGDINFLEEAVYINSKILKLNEYIQERMFKLIYNV